MGKRYYCDYCDKSFADNPTSRKTHLTGTSHIQNRRAHYDALRDEKEILQDDQNKKPCRAFLSMGECKFGHRCQYSHLTPEDKARLSEIVSQKEQAAELRLQKTQGIDTDLKSSLDEWAERRRKRQKLETEDTKTLKQNDVHRVQIPEYKLADCLSAFTSLPPSLLPPSKEGILNSDWVGWG